MMFTRRKYVFLQNPTHSNMKTISILVGTTAVLLGSAFTFILQSGNWKSDESNYSVTFKGGKIEGVFKGLLSTATIDSEHPERSTISASIDAATVDTGNGMMNKHAQSEEALDAAKYGTISFESTSVEKKDGVYSATGKLTMKGVTNIITIPFTFSETGKEGLLTGSFSVAPKEYGVTRNGTPEKVEIRLKIPYTRL